MLFCICLTCLLAAATCPVAQAASRYTDDMFRAALAKHSTSPDYVLATVRDARTGSSRVVCVESGSLEAALHIEHRQPWNEFGSRRVAQLLAASPDRTYTFSDPAALAHVTASYSPELLAKVRSILSSHSNAQLRSEPLGWLYVGKPLRAYTAYRDAAAHVLLERGILCARGCVVSNLIVDER
jgi:hypothetical protein